MSLVEQQLAPVLGLIDKSSLPKATQLVINIQNHIQTVDIRGHTYSHSTIIAQGNARAHFGDSSIMSHHSRHSATRNEHMPHNFNTPPLSETYDGAQVSIQGSANDDAPPEYRDRDFAWFTPGRLFKIYAPYDIEIHEKQFVLLDTKNKEGPGLLLRTYDEEEEKEIIKGYFLRSHVSVRNYTEPSKRQSDSKRKAVYLDEYEDQKVDPGTWIALEHSYNIPFAKYKCVDCGVIDRDSLKDLRRCFIAWLSYHWGLQ